ncbi:MAG TPA: creatininase family protein [Longimicrobiales bacterium]
MEDSRPSLALHELSWIDVAAHLARDSRLIVPVGALEQHGAHLPLGSNLLITERLARDLSEEFQVLRAPTFAFGVAVRSDRAFAGTASVEKKTLHRCMNELLSGWEHQGVSEFILITAHRHEPHLDSLATLVTRRARVRVVEVWDVDISDLLEAQTGPLHADEAETSVMLYLYPRLVRMDRARDFEPPAHVAERYMRGWLPAHPVGGAGAVGRPTAATAEKGRLIFHRILDAIRRAVFLAPTDLESDTL